MTLLFMMFMHIVDDFYLQGCLAKLKQKSWWEEETKKIKEPHPDYSNDYLMALSMHSFSWTFMVMLPILFNVSNFNENIFCLVFIANFLIHFFVDDLKANRYKINLITDQWIHIIQIMTTFMVCGICMGYNF